MDESRETLPTIDRLGGGAGHGVDVEQQWSPAAVSKAQRRRGPVAAAKAVTLPVTHSVPSRSA